jgi:NADH dehydrogenase FAD-containing subunit
MPKRLVLAGGGHAHLFTLSRWRVFAAAGIGVVCVAPGPCLSYSGMGPGLLSGRYAPEEIRFSLEGLLAGASATAQGGTARSEGPSGFVRGTVAGIDPGNRRLILADGRELDYDAVSFGLGSEAAPSFPVAAGAALYPVKPIENLLAARRDIESRVEAGQTARVLVVGGGPSGYEVAGNALALLAGCGLKKPQVTVVVGRGLLCGWPGRARRLALASLARRGARVLYGRVVRLEEGRAVLHEGTTVAWDVAFVATGTRPPGLFARCGLAAGDDGGLTVNAFLQSPFYPEIFGGGDCIHFGPGPLPRAGVYAVRQGPVLCANLLAFLLGGALAPFRRTAARYLAIMNSGDGRAILRWGPLVAEGAWCMALKEWIDRRFMRSFPPPA